jgi:hypothetical protein
MMGGLVGDTFMWEGGLHHLLEGSKISPARPSFESSVKMKMFEGNARRLTVVA